MKKLLISLLLLVLSLSLFACSTEAPIDEDLEGTTDTEVTDTEAAVHLASGNGDDYLPLRASFMSDFRTMAYTFDYDGNLLAMIDTPFDGASEYGASFKVEGGSEITSSTYMLADFVPPVNKTLDACSYTYEAVQHDQEVLLLQLRVCEGEDAGFGEMAMQNLLDGLMLEGL